MSFRVEVRRSARQELAAFTPENQARIARALLALRDDPFPAGVKKLHSSVGYRIRVGDYRILYTVDRTAETIFVSAIGNRKEVYR